MGGVPPYRMTFVCSGNICRSPIAEAVARRLAAERDLAVEIDSFGTGDWHVGEQIDPRAQATLRRHGYELRHRARVIEPGDIAGRDLIIALDRGHERVLRRLAPTPADAAKIRLLRSYDPNADGPDVPDPYYGGAAGFERALAMIEAACAGLVDQLAGAPIR